MDDNNSNFFRSPFIDWDDFIKIHGSHLPHWDQEGKYVFVTFRLSDSLPKEIREELKRRKDYWLSTHPEPWSDEVAREYHKIISNRLESLTDNGYGSCILRCCQAVKIIRDVLWHDDDISYKLYDYVIMPNHVHILIRVTEAELDEILQPWKSVSSHRMRKVFGQEWCGWMENYHDRLIRNEQHYNNVLRYIYKNFCQGGVEIGGRLYPNPISKYTS